MSKKAEDIAKAIDRMTLAELTVASFEEDLPMPGGDYDTLAGWMTRMGKSHTVAKRLIDHLEKHGHAERVPGVTVRSDGQRQRVTLIRSRVLGKAAG